MRCFGLFVLLAVLTAEADVKYDLAVRSKSNTSSSVKIQTSAICDSIHSLQCYGDDLENVGTVTSHEECCEACSAYPGCNAWTWNWQVGQDCYLKSACSDKRTDSDSYHSGYSDSPAPSPTPSPPSPTPGTTPFTALGCHSSTDLGTTSIWDAGGGTWQSCSLVSRSDGIKKCVKESGEVDETSIFFDMETLASKTGCFVWESKDCSTDMTLVSKIEFDFDFSQCSDVWAAPLWITPQNWYSPGGTSGEIDFLEMCTVGNAATNFGAGGQPGEYQMTWGSADGANGPKHFTLSIDDAGTLTTQICDLDMTGCFNGAHYTNFLNVITSKTAHHFVSDVWNGYGGDGGWTGCGAINSPATTCHYAIMNIRVTSKDGQPLYTGKCAALNGDTSSGYEVLRANSTFVVI